MKHLLRVIFQAPVITFIAGTLLGTAMQYFVENALTRNLMYLVIFISVFVFYAMFTAKRLSEDTVVIQKQNHTSTVTVLNTIKTEMFKAVGDVHENIRIEMARLGFSVRWIPNANREKDEGYELSLQVVKGAKKCIYILSDFSPEDQKQVYTQKREEYLTTIASVVMQHIRDGTNFEYKRIMQIQRDAAYFDGTLKHPDLSGDSQTFEHCKNIIANKRSYGGRADIRLYLSKFVPSAPSILIVDDKHILFTMPGKKGVIDGDETPDIKTVGVLHFVDNTESHEYVEDFKRMFSSYINDRGCKEIANVEQ